jgi:uncharacterized membrane protein YeaQ/YmgE (transglycosylase-associated protein family)
MRAWVWWSISSLCSSWAWCSAPWLVWCYPVRDPMGIGMTALVGLCGTFSAGLFSWYVLHRQGAGLVLSVLFSRLAVWIYRRSPGEDYRRRTTGGS